MKTFTSQLTKLVIVAPCLLFALPASTVKAQVTNYWDTNGDTDGSGGPSPSNYWEAPNWTTDQTGNSATGNWTEGSVPACHHQRPRRADEC
jgi:hypothetical protein